MRYQVVVFDEEIGSDFDVTEIGWQIHPTAATPAEFSGMKVYMGLCADESLGSTFEDNYIAGTRTLVYQNSLEVLSGAAGDWATVTLDDTFQYNSDEGNLVIEVTWDSCVNHKSLYVYSWDTGAIRAVGNTQAGAPSNPTGSLSSAMPRIILTGNAAGNLTSMTFGAVKNVCGQE